MQDRFHRFARRAAEFLGSNLAFLVAMLVVLAWAVTGPLFRFSDTWQLVINTATTIVTFLMVFLIQNTQNRDSLAMQAKLDELLRAVKDARNGLVDLENRPETEVLQIKRELAELAQSANTTPLPAPKQ